VINKIYKIGSYILNNSTKYLKYTNSFEDITDNGKYKNLIIIQLKKETLEFEKVDLEELTQENLHKYLYKTGSPNGLNYTPCSKITEPKKTLKIKILNFFKTYEKDSKFLKDIYSVLKNNYEKIQEDIETKYKSIGEKETALTIKIGNKYIGEFEDVQKIFNDKCSEQYYHQYKLTSKSNNKICSLCKKEKEVFGFVNTYQFYSVNEKGFVSGGFKQENAYKNYPVCKGCAKILETGKTYINNNLQNSFYNIPYLLIPYTTIQESDALATFFRKVEQYHQDTLKLKKDTKNKIGNLERRFLQLLGDNENFINFSFLFYEAPKGLNGSVFKIQLHIEDIVPSRLNLIFEKMNEINKQDYCLLYSNDKPYFFNIGVVRELYPWESKNHPNIYPFLFFVKQLFQNNKLSYKKILSDIILRLRKTFKQNFHSNEFSFFLKTVQFFALLNLLFKLDMFYDYKKQGGTIMSNADNEYDEFFLKNTDFFNSDEKKLLFLIGILVKKLLNIQFQERNATPFYKNLKALSLNQKDFQQIFTKTINKLNEYNKNYYADLEALITDYFIKAGDVWKLSKKEMNFTFALGLALNKKFNNKETNNE